MSDEIKLLNLGCGSSFHKDWINIDFVSNSDQVQVHNLLNGIPLGNAEVNVVYHSHVLEHFSKQDGLDFIKECYRVLKPNGRIRIAVPDLEMIVRQYLENLELAKDGQTEAQYNYEWIILELFDQMVRNTSGGEMKSYLFQDSIPNKNYVYGRIGMEGKKIRKAFLKRSTASANRKKNSGQSSIKGFAKKISDKFNRRFRSHKLTAKQKQALNIGEFRLGGEIHQWMYDRYSLSKLLKQIGFSDITICSAFESEIPNWTDYQLDTIDGEVRKPDSLFIEATKK